MPFKLRKVRGKDEYKVYDPSTMEISALYKTKDEATKYLLSLAKPEEESKPEPRKLVARDEVSRLPQPELKQDPVPECVDGSCVVPKKKKVAKATKAKVLAKVQ